MQSILDGYPPPRSRPRAAAVRCALRACLLESDTHAGQGRVCNRTGHRRRARPEGAGILCFASSIFEHKIKVTVNPRENSASFLPACEANASPFHFLYVLCRFFRHLPNVGASSFSVTNCDSCDQVCMTSYDKCDQL